MHLQVGFTTLEKRVPSKPTRLAILAPRLKLSMLILSDMGSRDPGPKHPSLSSDPSLATVASASSNTFPLFVSRQACIEIPRLPEVNMKHIAWNGAIL